MGTFRKEDLPPLPEGTCLSSSSPQLPALPPMLFNPLPLQRTTLLSTRSDSNWATAAGLSLLGVSPATVLEIPGNPLQHPQPCLTQATFGTILPSHTVPTFPWGLDLPTTEPLPLMMPTIPVSIIGTNPYGTRSSHQSLYQPSRSLSLDPPSPDNPLGNTSMGYTSHPPPTEPTHHLTNLESRSGSEGGQARPAAQTPPQSYSPR